MRPASSIALCLIVYQIHIIVYILVNGFCEIYIIFFQSVGQFGPGTSQRGNSLFIINAQNDDQDYYQCEGLINGEARANIYVYIEIESEWSY